MAALKHKLIELLARKESAEGKRYSQAEIARATSLPENTVSRWMNNSEIHRVDDKVLIKLCDFLDCNVGDLLYIDRRTMSDDSPPAA